MRKSYQCLFDGISGWIAAISNLTSNIGTVPSLSGAAEDNFIDMIGFYSSTADGFPSNDFT